MNINDDVVLDNLNNLIATHRFNKTQVLYILQLALISNDIIELKNNLIWENLQDKYKINIKNL